MMRRIFGFSALLLLLAAGSASAQSPMSDEAVVRYALSARQAGKSDQQIVNGTGYDHCYVLNKPESGALTLAATCTEPVSGRTMKVYTTENGVQLYTGNWLNGFAGAHGAIFPARSAICFEAQCFPDTPNEPHFPSAVLLPGDEYQQTTIYEFCVSK